MPAIRPWNRSWRASRSIAAAALAAVVAAPASARAQEAPPQELSVQTLFEAGRLDEVVDRSDSGHPSEVFLAAQALIKLERAAEARERFARLQASEDEVWALIGRSGAALLDVHVPEAVATARQAVALDGARLLAHYQLALAASRQGDFRSASKAFTRAQELQPDFAYAYYYGGLAHQRLREISRAADDLRTFLKLAPDAPEASAVQAILRTLR